MQVPSDAITAITIHWKPHLNEATQQVVYETGFMLNGNYPINPGLWGQSLALIGKAMLEGAIKADVVKNKEHFEHAIMEAFSAALVADEPKEQK